MIRIKKIFKDIFKRMKRLRHHIFLAVAFPLVFPLILQIPVIDSPDKVSFINGKYQVLNYSKNSFKGLKYNAMKVRDEVTSEIIELKIAWDCKEHPINKIINLELRVAEYSLFGSNQKKYSPFGGEVCLE